MASATAAALAGVATKSSPRVSWPSIGSQATAGPDAAAGAAGMPFGALSSASAFWNAVESTFALASAARVSATSFFAATGSASKMAMRARCRARKATAPSADSFIRSRAASVFCWVVGAGAAGVCWAATVPASMVVASRAATIPLEIFMATLLFEHRRPGMNRRVASASREKGSSHVLLPVLPPH